MDRFTKDELENQLVIALPDSTVNGKNNNKQ